MDEINLLTIEKIFLHLSDAQTRRCVLVQENIMTPIAK